MATHKSAEKRTRQSVKRNERNRARRSQILTASKAVEAALASKDVEGAKVALREAESNLARTARKGTIHWKTAARKASRLSKRIKAASGKAA